MKKTIITKLAVTATFATAIIGAAPIGDILVAHAATTQNIVNNPVADNTSNRSITIWKYQVKDQSEFGDPGNGKHKDDVNKTPLPGIKFKISKVEAIGGASLVDPMKSKEGKDYNIVSEAGTVTTGSDGSAKLDLGVGNASDGIYLVTELADDRGTEPAVAKPADPFFVQVPQTDREDHQSLIYDVEVQPKNVLESLLKPDKTVEDGKGYSIKAGLPFDWEATAQVPAGLYYVASQDSVITLYNPDGSVKEQEHQVPKGTEIYADYFTMTDTLDQRLLLDDVQMQVKKDNGDWTNLVLGTDYTVKVNDADKNTAPVTEQTVGAAKKVVTNLTNAGMKKVTTDADTQIRTVYTTHSDKDFNGTIANSFDTGYLTPGLKPVDKPSTNNPEEYTGGVNILKKAEDTNSVLAGAEFRIAENEDNAKAGIFLASDGKSYAKDATLPKDVNFLVSTSDKDGVAKFDGLKLDWFKDSNGNGKQDISIPSEATLPKDQIKKNYWIVETVAPNGYELLKAPKEIEVNLGTAADVKSPDVTVTDQPKTDLPFTGGQGTTLLIVIALGAISIGTAAIAIDKKRREA